MSSQRQSPSRRADGSTANAPESFAGNRTTVEIDGKLLAKSSQNDAHLIRSVVTDAIRKSGKSRAQIADEMSHLTGRRVTERMLNGYTAESREDCTFPSELERAFCTATGDEKLLRCRAELHGLRVIDAADAELVELGRAFLQRTQAEEQIAILERRLGGRIK